MVPTPVCRDQNLTTDAEVALHDRRFPIAHAAQLLLGVADAAQR
jgi:hypothetical protein